jgi:hypothetical protein
MDDFIDCTLPELLLLQSALRLQRITDRKEPIAKQLQVRLDTEIAIRRGLRATTSALRQRTDPDSAQTPE